MTLKYIGSSCKRDELFLYDSNILLLFSKYCAFCDRSDRETFTIKSMDSFMKCQTPQNDTFILNIDNEYFCNSHSTGNDMQK